MLPQVVLALGHSKPQTTTNSVDLLRKLLVKVAPIKQQTNLRDASVKGIIFLLAWLIKGEKKKPW